MWFSPIPPKWQVSNFSCHSPLFFLSKLYKMAYLLKFLEWCFCIRNPKFAWITVTWMRTHISYLNILLCIWILIFHNGIFKGNMFNSRRLIFTTHHPLCSSLEESATETFQPNTEFLCTCFPALFHSLVHSLVDSTYC